MPGMPILHGYNTSASPAGEGGAARVLAPAQGVPSNFMFVAWLILLGVVIPGAILGGLRAGKFQFVFTSR